MGKIWSWIYDNVILPVWEGIKKVLDVIISSIKLHLSFVTGFFTALGGILIAPFQTLWEMVKNVFSNIKTTVKGIYNVFKGIFTGDMKTVFNGFKQIVKGVFGQLWSIAKAPLNLIIRGFNSLIRGANKIHIDIPSWVPSIGGKTFGINIKEIPLLAKGGIVAKPTQAIIGEAGREAVMPLENNIEWMDILADRIASRIGDNNGGAYIINLDSRTVQRGIARRERDLAFVKNGR